MLAARMQDPSLGRSATPGGRIACRTSTNQEGTSCFELRDLPDGSVTFSPSTPSTSASREGG